ncbi:MAG: glycosyltransferase family 2 protein [Desulfarculaceae bacterium]|nr:glycosyltransferase family 2 protein [Desulfarculaceae bacterium]MCF8047426.1 glycosyltransferase family 2 protein [Desulfarculaceae bacterium]MCF8097032.1 glycosyltransferase family 2 protein [Desulfarculaceae bacterium]MCF8122084.1 glycosyltransferase family 2 protein [Desulfarculaceae bacterium]
MHSKDILIDVLLVNYNSTPFLRQCLASLVEQNLAGRLRILVRDNASQDRAEAVRGMLGVELVQGKENIGYSRGINSLARLGKAPYLLLLNPDCILQPNFCDQALAYMEAKPLVGGLGPLILDPEGTVQGSARKFPSVLTGLFGRSSLLSRLLPGNAATRREILTETGPPREPMACDWISGACLLVRREAFEQIGGMDEDYFLFWEDADLCARLHQTGWDVIYYPRPTVVHQVGGSRRSNMIRSIWHFHRSAFLWLKKHGTPAQRALLPVWAMLLGLRLAAVITMHTARLAWLEIASRQTTRYRRRKVRPRR